MIHEQESVIRVLDRKREWKQGQGKEYIMWQLVLPVRSVLLFGGVCYAFLTLATLTCVSVCACSSSTALCGGDGEIKRGGSSVGLEVWQTEKAGGM